jgi:hypothetical protein
MTDVSAASGITFVSRTGEGGRVAWIPEAKGTGVTLFDYDRDGILDVLLVAGSTLERERAGSPGFGAALYRGRGGLRWEDVTAASGIRDLRWTNAAAAGDVNGDGWDDLLVTGLSGIRLLVNERGAFRDAGATALPETARNGGWCTSAAFLDVDADGDLDAFVARYLAFDLADPPLDGKAGRSCRWKGHPVICGPRGLEALPDLLLRNRGDGTFEDATAAAGIGAARPAYGLGVLPLDFDRDGRTDVYVANDMTPSHLWRNDGGRFTEVGVALGVAYSADGAPEAGMGVDAADLDGDGIEEILKTNFEGEPNDLYRSSPNGWLESSTRAGIAAADRPHVGWGCAIRDFDGDGFGDLFVANGHVYPEAALPGLGSSWAQPRVLHLGGPTGRFTRFAGPGAEDLAAAKVSRAAAFGDLDDDGDVDVVIVNVNDRPTILRTDAPPGTWTGFAIRGPARNPHGLGAIVTLRGDGFSRSATVRAQASFQATNDPRVVFRLSPGQVPSSVEVALPGRPVVRSASVQPGSYHELAVE